MNNKIALNVDKCYELYCKDKNAYPQITEAVTLYVYQYPLVVSRQYEELCGDFWSAIAHKIPKYITNFIYTSIPFERYLSLTMKFQFITFLNNTIRHTKETRMYNKAHALFSIAPWEDTTHSKKELGMELLIWFINEHVKTNTSHERLWWLLLHYSPMFPITRISEMGDRLGVAKEEVHRVLESLKEDIQQEQIRLNILQGRCNMYFAQRALLDRELEEDILSKQEELRIKERRETYNQRYRKLARQLQNTMGSISHARLSEVLGVPKGTIDCGIALLKKQCLKFKNQARETGLV